MITDARFQALCQLEGLPALSLHPVQSYGCTLCQKWHEEDSPEGLEHRYFRGKNAYCFTKRHVWHPASVSWVSWLDQLENLRNGNPGT